MSDESGCECWPTDPSTWTTYGSAVEPGSTLEPNPECPVHYPENMPQLRRYIDVSNAPEISTNQG